MLDAHGRDPDVAHLPLESLAGVEEDRRVQLRRDLGHGGVGQLRALRKDVDGLLSVRPGEPGGHVRHVLRVDPIHDDSEDRAVLVAERPAGGAHRRDGLLRRAAADDDEHRSAQLVGEVRVSAEGERGRTAEVGALADDEVAALLERLVRLDDALAQLLVLDLARLVLGERMHLLVGGVELVAAANELELGIALGPRGHDRPEEAEPLDPGREQLHHAEGDDRLPATRLHARDVEVASHRYT